MEKQIIEAALLTVSAVTESGARHAASSSLESWTLDSGSWQHYLHLMHLMFSTEMIEEMAGQNNKYDAMGAKLLLLTMLHSKCRRGLTKQAEERSRLLEMVYSCLRVCGSGETTLSGQLCSVAAAVAVRSVPGGVRNLVEIGCSDYHAFGLKLLSCLPEEVDSVDWAGKDEEMLRAELSECVGRVLDRVRSAVMGDNQANLLLALQVLRNWVGPCHITISDLYSQPNNASSEPTILFLLTQILSHHHPTSSHIIIAASNALTESLIVLSDSASLNRDQAIAFLLNSIPSHAFLKAPFTYASNHAMHDAAHAISTLACTLATEEIDILSAYTLPGTSDLIEFLLTAQLHPHTPVALAVLDVWLALQDIPVPDRHTHLAFPLFSQVLDTIIRRISYPPQFTSWSNDDDLLVDLDSAEFHQMRNMVHDVLVSIYFLLRANFIQQILAAIIPNNVNTPHHHHQAPPWNAVESTLYCLTSISREACARVKARGNADDRNATSQQLLTLTQHLCANGVEPALHQHPVVLLAIARYLGAFAPVWSTCCTSDAILHVVHYLRMTLHLPLIVEAASLSIKSILIVCSRKLLQTQDIFSFLPSIVDAVLSSDNEAAMLYAAEGTTRFITNISNTPVMLQALSSITAPVLHRTHAAMDAISSQKDPGQLEIACQAFVSNLRVLKEIIKFCEFDHDHHLKHQQQSQQQQHPLTDLLGNIYPMLSTAAYLPICRQHEPILQQILAVHTQLLSTVPTLVAPHIPDLITFVVQAYEETYLPCSLDYVGAAVEHFGNEAQENFQQLLNHLIQCTCGYVTREKHPTDCPLLIRSFFDMTRRYLLFCPMALVHCQEFTTLFSLAVACLTECRGERESTRATFNFLTQLITWNTSQSNNGHANANATTHPNLKLSSAKIIESLLFQNGQTLTKCCIAGLAGSMPQMLWPSLSEFLFAILSHVVYSSSYNTGEGDNTIAHQWVSLAISDPECISADTGIMTDDMKTLIVQILFFSIKKGPKSKPMVKMLLMDFGKICSGEMSKDSLLSYSLKDEDN